jgi:hypothetical protein
MGDTIPEGAPRSDDGQWWWDGTQWQPVPQEDDQGEYALTVVGQPTLNGAGVEWMLCNTGSAEAPVNSFGGSLSFEFYPEGGYHEEVAKHDAYLHEAIPAGECRTLGVIVTNFVSQDGHYQVYLTSPTGTPGEVEFIEVNFNLANGVVIEPTG